MKIWKFSLLVVFLILLFLFVIYRIIDQHDLEFSMKVVNNTKDLLWKLGINLLVVFNVFFFCAIAGFVCYHLVQIFDILVDRHLDLTKLQTVLITILVAAVFAGVYTRIFRISMAEPDTWILKIATETYFGWQPWDGKFTLSPVLWSIYGFFTFILGFVISPKIMQYIRAFHSYFRIQNLSEDN
jgi:hypothetical protein